MRKFWVVEGRAEESVMRELGATWIMLHPTKEWWVELKWAEAQGPHAVRVCSGGTKMELVQKGRLTARAQRPTSSVPSSSLGM